MIFPKLNLKKRPSQMPRDVFRIAKHLKPDYNYYC